jgi:hypothetical protein
VPQPLSDTSSHTPYPRVPPGADPNGWAPIDLSHFEAATEDEYTDYAAWMLKDVRYAKAQAATSTPEDAATWPSGTPVHMVPRDNPTELRQAIAALGNGLVWSEMVQLVSDGVFEVDRVSSDRPDMVYLYTVDGNVALQDLLVPVSLLRRLDEADENDHDPFSRPNDAIDPPMTFHMPAVREGSNHPSSTSRVLGILRRERARRDRAQANGTSNTGSGDVRGYGGYQPQQQNRHHGLAGCPDEDGANAPSVSNSPCSSSSRAYGGEGVNDWDDEGYWSGADEEDGANAPSAPASPTVSAARGSGDDVAPHSSDDVASTPDEVLVPPATESAAPTTSEAPVPPPAAEGMPTTPEDLTPPTADAPAALPTSPASGRSRKRVLEEAEGDEAAGDEAGEGQDDPMAATLPTGPRDTASGRSPKRAKEDPPQGDDDEMFDDL